MRQKINVQEWQFREIRKVESDETARAFQDARYIKDDKERLDCYLSQIEHSRFHEADLRDLQYLMKKINNYKMGYNELVTFVNTWGC